MYNFYILMGMVLFIQVGMAITMTKEEVLTLEVSNYKTEQQCPEYSTGYYNNIACSFHFYCFEDRCQSVYANSTVVELTNSEGQPQKYIIESCSERQVQQNECHLTELCSTDTDCITNKCLKGACVRGGQSSFTECRDSNQSFFVPWKTVMKCGKILGEECLSDHDCPGKCYEDDAVDSPDNRIKVCHEYSVRPFNTGDCLLYGAFFLGILFLIYVMYRILRFCFSRSKNYNNLYD